MTDPDAKAAELKILPSYWLAQGQVFSISKFSALRLTLFAHYCRDPSYLSQVIEIWIFEYPWNPEKSDLVTMVTKKEGGQEGDSNSDSVWHCGDGGLF